MMSKLFKPRLRVHYEEYNYETREWEHRTRDYHFFFLIGWFIDRCRHNGDRIFQRIERLR